MSDHKYPIGARVVANSSAVAYRGKTATVISHYAHGLHLQYGLEFDDAELRANGNGGRWSEEALDLLVDPVAPGRPTINFSGEGRQTARKYAIGIRFGFTRTYTISPLLREPLDDIVNESTSVDALRLNETLMAAQRVLAQRAAPAADKERWQRQIGYLHHITQAVLESAIDQLPAYEPGERSPALRKAEERIKSLQEALAGKVAREDTLVADINEHDVEITRLDAELTSERGKAEVLTEVLGYALGKVGDDDRERILGYWDALEPELDHFYEEEDQS